jgi:hypothetical protein
LKKIRNCFNAEGFVREEEEGFVMNCSLFGMNVFCIICAMMTLSIKNALFSTFAVAFLWRNEIIWMLMPFRSNHTLPLFNQKEKIKLYTSIKFQEQLEFPL